LATLTNRCRFVVALPRRPELTREFPHDKQDEATSYLKSLRECKDLKKASLSQGDDHWYVRIAGFPLLGTTQFPRLKTT
jgi:hypothetical protein